MEGITHAVAVIGDLIVLGHISQATITCNCGGDEPHVITMVWDPNVNDVLIKGPGKEDA